MPVAELSATRPAEDAFAAHVLPQVEVLARVALSLTRNQADAEDLVQETLLNAYRAIDRFDGRFPRAWLLTIMRNTEKKRHRRRRPQLLRDPDQVERVAAAHAAGKSDAPEEIAIGRELDTAVLACLDRLPEHQRRAAELVDVDGFSYAEAALALGVPVGTIMSRLFRARARIRAGLAAAGFVPERSMR